MLENELRRAIGRGEFLLHYLAKFDLKSKSITGAEALLRWHHPDLRQAAFLREQACDAMQGFYVNEPTAAPDFGRLLRHQAELAAQKPAPGQQ